MEMTKTLFDLLVENGGDDQAIADMLSENLNTAISQYREKEQIQKKKRDAEALADHFNTFVEIYYPDCPKIRFLVKILLIFGIVCKKLSMEQVILKKFLT